MTTTLLLILLIIFLGEFVRSSIGFGNALVGMPLLVLVVDLRTATPLFALAAFTGSASILWTSWRDVDLRDAWRLNIGALLGIPAGIWLLNNMPPQVGVLIIAVLIILYGLYSIFAPPLPHLQKEWPAFFVGAFAGMTNAAFNIAGPPTVIYGTLRRWSPARFRATMQAFFAPSSFLVIIGHGASGLWTPTVLSTYIWTIPVALFAAWTGGLVNQRLPHAAFRKVVNIFLLIIGVFMLVRL